MGSGTKNQNRFISQGTREKPTTKTSALYGYWRKQSKNNLRILKK